MYLQYFLHYLIFSYKILNNSRKNGSGASGMKSKDIGLTESTRFGNCFKEGGEQKKGRKRKMA